MVYETKFSEKRPALAAHLDRTVMLSQSSVYHEILCDSGCEAVFAEDFFCLFLVSLVHFDIVDIVVDLPLWAEIPGVEFCAAASCHDGVLEIVA